MERIREGLSMGLFGSISNDLDCGLYQQCSVDRNTEREEKSSF